MKIEYEEALDMVTRAILAGMTEEEKEEYL